MGGLATATIVAATPLTLAALGGVMSERSGVVNIALEGIMLTAAFVGYAAALFSHSLGVGILAAIVSGMLIAALHAVLSIEFFVDQIVSGTVINILAVGITGVFYRTFIQETNVRGPGTLPVWKIPLLGDIPVLGSIFFQHQAVTYAMLVLVVAVHLVLFNSVWGLRTRACGEHPQAADTAGISVKRVRYVNVISSGALGGLGGAYFTIQQIGNFLPNITGGRGFIALAAMIFGKWTPIGAFFASLLFACADALGARLQYLGVRLPYQFLGMLPYVLTIVVVAGAMGRAVAPAAVGRPYRKN
ncbi:MAG: ABC transporter permease [Candidatus Nephthysia bennettiae]|uniref:ABC transporter permease n=1 Tax=Candidatus Nephthysia bennettiae TaxID=3127016 RepID=A0A934K2R8_9BACT|nr:ABC transporter permease [Candidatus Dormibacteraeota bacterium]MBJ7614137.1 ABC transporter permease [Candidatus Dormibacteraeota bacterium]PZS00083.1 MAG: ABC transporter permease [Candidatus Dormibacteraeota bacterium]